MKQIRSDRHVAIPNLVRPSCLHRPRSLGEAQVTSIRKDGKYNSRLNLPIEFMMQASSNNVRDIAIKTIPSASKTEIKRVLQSVYGFQVEKVRTLNMQGKKKKMAGRLMAIPGYKKAYVTLKNLSSLSPHLFYSHSIKEETMTMTQRNQILST